MPTRHLLAITAVGCGAALGAVLRWALGSAFDALLPALPVGTLAANLVGGFLIGVAVGVFDRRLDLAPELRLFVITGFLGGLTTFSTFSAEVVGHLAAGRIGIASIEIAIHVLGSVLLTVAGLFAAGWFVRRPPADEPGAALERLAGE